MKVSGRTLLVAAVVAWTFAADARVRVGLVSQGGDSPPATARFDYFRTYRPAH